MNHFEAALYAGIGLALKSKEKIEEAARKFAAESKMNAEEGQKFVSEMIASAETAKEDFSAKVEAIVKQKITEAGFATKEDIADLKAQIAKLEAAVKKA